MSAPIRTCRVCNYTEEVRQGVRCTFVEADLCGRCHSRLIDSQAYEHLVANIQRATQSPAVVLVVFHRDKLAEVIAAMDTESNNNFGAMLQSIADQVNGVSGKVTEGLCPPQPKDPGARAPGS